MSKWIKVQEHPKKVYVVKHTRLGSNYVYNAKDGKLLRIVKSESPEDIRNDGDKEPDFSTPNAPIKYAIAGSKGMMIGYGIIAALYVIGVIVGLCLGYGWSSLLLPFLPFVIIGFIGYIWELFKTFYNLGYDEKRRI